MSHCFTPPKTLVTVQIRGVRSLLLSCKIHLVGGDDDVNQRSVKMVYL